MILQPRRKNPSSRLRRSQQKAATEEMQLYGGAAAIEKALASPTQLDFADTPLQDVVDYLKDVHHIEIQLDRRVLEDVNVKGDTPVTISVKGVTLKSALRLMLRNMQPELTYMIKDEVLLITTPDIAERRTHHRSSIRWPIWSHAATNTMRLGTTMMP